MNAPTILRAELAGELYRALMGRYTVPPLRARGLGLEIDDAYAISLSLLAHRLRAGERVIGKKIGVTSKAVQDMLGVHQPDFGFLTDAMWIRNGDTVRIGKQMIQQRAEAEIALDRFPAGDRMPKLMSLVGSFRFALATEFEPDYTDPAEDDRFGVILGLAQLLDGVVFTPSGMERFFDAFAALDTPGPAAFEEVGAEVGVAVVGPPLAQSDPL